MPDLFLVGLVLGAVVLSGELLLTEASSALSRPRVFLSVWLPCFGAWGWLVDQALSSSLLIDVTLTVVLASATSGGIVALLFQRRIGRRKKHG